MAHNNDHHNNSGGGNGNGGTNAGASGGAAQSGNGLPSWLTSGNGGTGAPVPVSAWLDPSYPGGYAGWLSDHPDPGHSPNPPSNPVYREWLQQQVGSDGQLHLPPAGAVGSAMPAPSSSSSGGVSVSNAVAAPTYHNPAANVPQVPEAVPANPNPVTYPVGVGGPDYPDNSPTPPNHIPVAGGGVAQNSTLSVPHGNNGSGGTSAPANNGGASASSVTVRRGDTLSGIAAQHGISLARLETLNPQIKNPNLIHAGETIHLGGADSAVAGSGGVSAPGSDGSSLSVSHGNGSGGTVASNHGFRNSGQPSSGSGGIAAPITTATTGSPGANGGTVASASSGFPTSSTYPPVENSENGTLNRIKNLGIKIKGWGGNGSSVADDPAKRAISVADNRDTNPLSIKDKGNNSRA